MDLERINIKVVDNFLVQIGKALYKGKGRYAESTCKTVANLHIFAHYLRYAVCCEDHDVLTSGKLVKQWHQCQQYLVPVRVRRVFKQILNQYYGKAVCVDVERLKPVQEFLDLEGSVSIRDIGKQLMTNSNTSIY